MGDLRRDDRATSRFEQLPKDSKQSIELYIVRRKTLWNVKESERNNIFTHILGIETVEVSLN